MEREEKTSRSIAQKVSERHVVLADSAEFDLGKNFNTSLRDWIDVIACFAWSCIVLVQYKILGNISYL